MKNFMAQRNREEIDNNYLMKSKKKVYLALLLFILMPFVSVHSQMSSNGANSLKNLNLIDTQSNYDKFEEPGEDDSDGVEIAKRAKPEFNFEDKKYGYTGGKNFVNPPQEKFFDETLSYFGYDFFVDAPTTFSPAARIPIPPDYLLGPNDGVRIILFGNKNATYSLTVTRDGEIFFPEIGPISVAGLTFLDFKETIQQVVANQIIGTKVSVTLGRLRSIDIFVLGEAYQPGMYTVSALATLTNAIFESGGVNVTGSLRNIQLKRNGKVISTFDFYDLLLKGDTSNDVRLMQGDVVFIPPITKTVGTSGEVGRPAIYELKDNETLGDLIKFAGNLKPKADMFSANISRINPSVNGFSLIPVDLNASSQGSFELNDGDVLSIHSVVDNLKNAVLMTGHAQQPGFFPWKKGMRIGDLIKSPDNLLSMTDLNYVLIKRNDPLNQNYQFLQIDLEEIFKNDATNATDANIFLLEKDEIILLPSLLTPEQITTKLIQDNYIKKDGQMILEQDEWTSLTYLRKSLMDEELSVGENVNPLTGQRVGGDIGASEEQQVRRYYEYSIYHYCTIPEDLAVVIIESSGFRAKKSVPLEELEKLTTPNDIKELQRQIEIERLKFLDYEEASKQINTTITNICRRQLLDPVIGIINRQIMAKQEKRTISVFGSVHFPGVYPLTEGMVLEGAIKSAGGLKGATYDSEIEISRSSNAGKKFSVSNAFVSISDEDAMQTKLQEMDIINLKQIPTGVKTVEVTGEVYFAGTYPISENQTLAELIKRAGGITEYGSLKAAYFQRQSLREAELERLKNAKNELKRKILLSSQSGGLGQNSLDNNSISQLTSLIVGGDEDEEVLGRLVVDLESIIQGLTEDVILEDGDSLHIPTTRQSVAVIGEVFVANSHLYKDDLSVSDYLDLSGGANAYADVDNVYLIRSDGSIVPPTQISTKGFFKRSSHRLQPGDTIVVPLEVQPFSGIRATTEITQIIYQMALAAAAVNSF